MNLELQAVKEEFSEWARDHKHTVMVTYPKSGRNAIGGILRAVTGKPIMMMQGILRAKKAGKFNYEDVLLFIVHRSIYQIKGDRGRYIFLFRDPRDSILSRAYHMGAEAIPPERGTESRIHDEGWLDYMIWDWQMYFDDLLKYNPLLVQYEKFCLFPEITIGNILNYLSEPIPDNLSQVISNWDCLKLNPRIPNELVHVRFDRDIDRYTIHCLKWQRSPLVDEKYTSRIWEKLGDLMVQYGYTETGHDMEALQQL